MKNVLFLILTMLSCPASAAWTQYSETSEATFYIDLDTVKKEGNNRIFWQMMDYKQISQDGDKSARVKIEVDCKKEMLNFLDFAAFTGQNLSGAMSGQVTPQPEWSHIPPGTPNAKLMRAVCK